MAGWRQIEQCKISLRGPQESARGQHQLVVWQPYTNDVGEERSLTTIQSVVLEFFGYIYMLATYSCGNATKYFLVDSID